VIYYLAAILDRTPDATHLENYGLKEFLLSLSIIGGFISENVWLPLAPASTLTIELKFYLISALIFVFVEKCFKNRQFGLFLFGVIFLIAYIVIDITGSQYRWFGALRYSPLFVLGAVTYYAQNLGFRNKGVLILFVLSSIMTLHFTFVTLSSTGYAGFDISPVRITTAILFFSMFGLLNYLVRNPPNTKSKKMDQFFGDLTYPLYLVQIPVLVLVHQFFDMSGFADWLALYLLTLLVSLAINMFLERPLISLRQKWRGKAI
jgi:peptidoglycan/LPS O-acetylase OafA/YrhL